MAEDDAATIRTLDEFHKQIELLVRQHHGHMVSSPGNDAPAEFPSGAQAAQCGLEIHQILQACNVDPPAERRRQFLIGIFSLSHHAGRRLACRAQLR